MFPSDATVLEIIIFWLVVLLLFIPAIPRVYRAARKAAAK